MHQAPATTAAKPPKAIKPLNTENETHTQLVRRARKIDRQLAETYPDAHCELDFTTPLELLVATILSAQTTDKLVNTVTPTLFAKYRTAEDYARRTVTRWRRSSSRPASSAPRPTA